MKARRAGSLALALALCGMGCAAPTIYSWGRYENLVYGMYRSPDKVTPDVQVRYMEEDLHKANSRNKPVPPGFHAHLGYLYYQLGNPDRAQQEFETEKTKFPESAVFMDRMLANLAKP